MRGLGERPRGAAKQECFMALLMAGWHGEGVGGLAGTGTARGGLGFDSGGTLEGLWGSREGLDRGGGCGRRRGGRTLSAHAWHGVCSPS